MLKARIVRVDMDGYWGRDYHPEKSDNGLEVKLVDVMTFIDDERFVEKEPNHVAIVVEDIQEGVEGAADIYQVFTGVTEDGRLLQLIDHEIEIIGGRP
jgi:hypothetical protein